MSVTTHLFALITVRNRFSEFLVNDVNNSNLSIRILNLKFEIVDIYNCSLLAVV